MRFIVRAVPVRVHNISEEERTPTTHNTKYYGAGGGGGGASVCNRRPRALGRAKTEKIQNDSGKRVKITAAGERTNAQVLFGY